MSELQGRELDAALARALGNVVDENKMFPWKEGEIARVLPDDYRAMPHYSLSLDSMHDVEDELERRGMSEEYAEALIRVLKYPELYDTTPGDDLYPEPEIYTNFYGAFQVMHATAEQKARAALAVLTSK